MQISERIKMWASSMTRRIVVGLVILNGTALMTSQTAQGEVAKKYMLYDFGRVSCGFWLEVRATRDKPLDNRFTQGREWISGWISAFNYYMEPSGDVTSGTDREGLYAWLDRYCQDNPTTPLAGAVVRLIEHLKK